MVLTRGRWSRIPKIWLSSFVNSVVATCGYIGKLSYHTTQYPPILQVSAKFADEHIEGSPFTCKVTGEGKKRNAISVGASSDLTLPDSLSDYDLRALEAYIISPSGAEEPCYLKKLPKVCRGSMLDLNHNFPNPSIYGDNLAD